MKMPAYKSQSHFILQSHRLILNVFTWQFVCCIDRWGQTGPKTSLEPGSPAASQSTGSSRHECAKSFNKKQPWSKQHTHIWTRLSDFESQNSHFLLFPSFLCLWVSLSLSLFLKHVWMTTESNVASHRPTRDSESVFSTQPDSSADRLTVKPVI